MPQREMFPHFGQALFVGLALPPVSEHWIEDDPQRDAGAYPPHLIRSPTDHRSCCARLKKAAGIGAPRPPGSFNWVGIEMRSIWPAPADPRLVRAAIAVKLKVR